MKTSRITKPKNNNNAINNAKKKIAARRNFRRRRLINRRTRLQRRINNSNKFRNNIMPVSKIQNSIKDNNNKLTDKINKLSDKLSKLSLELFPKTTNIFRRLKEPRVDKIVTPMDMGLSHCYTSIFKTGNRIRYMSLYNRYEVSNNTTAIMQSYLWFPYAINFNSYPDLAITVSDGTEQGTRQPDVICPLLRASRTQGVVTALTNLTVFDTASCGLVGNYRLVGASLKMTNVTPFTLRGGSYVIYKLNENTTYPPFYNDLLKPNHQNAIDYTDTIRALIVSNHDQVMLKQSFSGSDIAFIHEYNTYEGNNIFQIPNEYIGSSYISSAEPVAQWDGNPQGCNIKYQIDIPPTPSGLNTYLIETWQIIEIIPDPSLHLDNITDFQTHVFNEDVIDQMRKDMPIKKSA